MDLLRQHAPQPTNNPNCERFDPNNPDHLDDLKKCVEEANTMKELQEEVGIHWTPGEWQQYVKNCMEKKYDFE